jgi:uncharacterized protein YraI
VLDLAGLAALGGLAVFFTSLDEFQPFLFQGGFPALGLATAAAIAVAVHPLSRLVPWLLGLPPMRYVGLRSYSIYLWHWPVFMLTRPDLDVPLDGVPLFALRAVLTLVLAEASYRIIEVPCRAGALGRMWRSLRAVPGVPATRLAARRLGATAACLGLVLVGAAVVNAQPPPPPEELASGSISMVFTTEPTATPAPPVVEPTAGQPLDAAVPTSVRPAPAPTYPPSVTPVPLPPTATAVIAEAVPWIDVNVRSGPGKAYPGIAVAHKGESLTILSRTADTGWYAVRTSGGVQGWAYSGALTVYPPAASVPVGDIAAVPATPGTATSAVAAAPQPTTSPTVGVIAGIQPATPPATSTGNDGALSALPPPTGTEEPVLSPTPGTPGPQPSPWPTRDPGPVFAIGDSVMLGAARDVGQALGNVEVNAAVSRQVSDAIGVLQWRSNQGTLPQTVVVHMGTNGPFTARQFDQMMRPLANVPRVIFLNVKVPRAWEVPNNKVIAEGVARYPNAMLVDWYAATADHPELFSKDGVHLQPPGRRLYAAMISEAVRMADPLPWVTPSPTPEFWPTPTATATPTPTVTATPTALPTFPPGIDPTLPTETATSTPEASPTPAPPAP